MATDYEKFRDSSKANADLIDCEERCLAAEEQVAELRDLLENLCEALRYVHADPDYVAVWVTAQMHGGEYKGATYTKELAAAEEYLWGGDESEND